MRSILPVLASAAALATMGVGCTTSSSGGPDILAVTPHATDNGNGTWNVDLVVDFNDSLSGDLVDAYTFQTDDGQINDVDVPIPESASPITIAGITIPMSEFGTGSLGFHLILWGSTSGAGSQFNGTINIQ